MWEKWLEGVYECRGCEGIEDICYGLMFVNNKVYFVGGY